MERAGAGFGGLVKFGMTIAALNGVPSAPWRLAAAPQRRLATPPRPEPAEPGQRDWPLPRPARPPRPYKTPGSRAPDRNPRGSNRRRELGPLRSGSKVAAPEYDRWRASDDALHISCPCLRAADSLWRLRSTKRRTAWRFKS